VLTAVCVPLGAQSSAELKAEVAELRALVYRLQARVAELEMHSKPTAPPALPVTPLPEPTSVAGTTINFLIDGYYGYNFNAPIGRANRLRAYDVSSNSFSINQAGLVLENAADPAKGKRWGARLDLQWGQATQTLQGNPANESRPEIFRNLFQAYGTFIVPLGKGLKVDFGKWASSLGIESNYTQDQMNYSRSYWFNFLPFYHMGVRTNYQFSDKFGINYWVTNGTQQTEAFNGFKDQIQRLYKNSPPQHADGGAVYAEYQFTNKFALAGRAEYFSDRGALFSGLEQALKEATLTTTYRFADSWFGGKQGAW
jgi:hypothetical protein